MTTNSCNSAGAAAGSGNNSSCYSCHVSISFIDHVSKMSDEFEMDAAHFDMEAKSKSDIFISKLRRSLLSILLETSKNKVENSNVYSSLPAPEKPPAIENNFNSTAVGDGDGQDFFVENEELTSKSQPKPKLKPLKRLKMLQERAKENDRVNKAIQVRRIETPGNSIAFYQCLICERQFNTSGNARRHVKVVHFTLGTLCPQPYCKKRFFNTLVLQSHISKCNKTSKPNTFKKMNRKEPTVFRTGGNKVKSSKVHVNQNPTTKEKALTLIYSSSSTSLASSRSSVSSSPPRKSQEKKFRSRRLTMDTPLGEYTFGQALNAKILLTPLKIVNMDPGDYNNMEETETPDPDSDQTKVTNRTKEEKE